ncbi:MAG: putative portal protein [Prokaryotic dsDNA virus sp.]|nr:MAG: putative portal protein [Prokaryotic dsDNA virus sp.]|tara:strand:+ start:11677 stop:13983 length:2307 start_codon:yes stop_codon:yes gene_type:complete
MYETKKAIGGKKASKKSNRELLDKVKERFKMMSEADGRNRREAMEDMKFANVPGAQWDDNMKQERGNRPCYEFNKVRISSKRIINEMRANRPAAKVRPVETGDKEVAETLEGLCRNIWSVSDAETITDYAAEYQVNGGMAAWRVDVDYTDDDVFTQDIMVRQIANPFCLYADPACKDILKRDANDWILTEKISRVEFEQRYSDVEVKEFDSNEFDDQEDWQDDDAVRIAEYWYKKPHTKELWQLNDGRVVDSESDEAESEELVAAIQQRRQVETTKICMAVVCGDRILEGPVEWAGSQFPFIMVYGEHVVIDGRTYWWGLPRFAKDAQRSYNIARTAISETIAQTPKSKWWATPKQAAGLTQQWSEAHQKNLPFMLYNPDEKAPGAPTLMPGADVPMALIQESQLASDEIKSTTGIFDASLGMRSNEVSGRAIYARQNQGEIATFNYQDNMAKGVQRTYEILLDLIPHIYDTERELRILGSDGADDYVRVNQIVTTPDGDAVRVNDITTGKYDIHITVGPNFSTQRQEAAETYGALAQQFPDLMGFAGDLVFKSLDLPYAEDIADRLRVMLPPPVQQLLNQDANLPPEVVQAMAQAEQAMQQVQQLGAAAEQASAEAEKDGAVIAKEKAELGKQMADIDKAKAVFDAHMAKQMEQLYRLQVTIAKSQAAMAPGIAVHGEFLDAQGNVEEVRQRIAEIDEILAGFMKAADEAVDFLDKKTERKVVGGSTSRENGKLVADIEYDDGSTRTISAVRNNGKLEIEPEADAGP